MHSLGKLAVEQSINLSFEDNSQTTPIVTVDYDKIYECVYNIVVNAIKYTPEGGNVCTRLNCGPSDCIIEVEDDGEGIPDSEKAKVFDRFYRLDNSRARDTG